MQTKPESDVSILCGATQVPILRREDVRPGIMFAGIALDHVQEVQAIEGDTVVLQRLPRTAQPPDHVHAYTQYGNTICACGLARIPIARLLSEDGSTPRIFALVPQGELVMPDEFSIYLLLGPGGPRTMTIERQGDSTPTSPTPAGAEVPIICKAHKIWSLPQELRGFLELAPSNGPLSDPETEQEA